MVESQWNLNEHLPHIAPGEVRTFVCAHVGDVVSHLEAVNVGDRRLVVHLWEMLPHPHGVIDDILHTIAQAAAGLWPAWYGVDELFSARDGLTTETALLNQFKCLDIAQTSPTIHLPWLKQAVQACQRGTSPRLPDFSHAVQLAQLLLAIAPHRVILILAVDDLNSAPHQRLGLARAVQWLADKTQAPIALMLPALMATAPELDSVLYGKIVLPPVGETALPGHPSVKRPTEEAKHRLVPVRGRPHPFSPGEKLLAERLAQDTELAPLFKFNQTVRTVRNSGYLADLLWDQGKIVVEVDGYRYHRDRVAFGRDRHRDYELLISGYLVLRLPHDEVISDSEVALEKIRDVVRLRRHPYPEREVHQEAHQ